MLLFLRDGLTRDCWFRFRLKMVLLVNLLPRPVCLAVSTCAIIVMMY